MTAANERGQRRAGIVRPSVRRVFVGQLILLLALAGGMVFYQLDIALSLLLGGLIQLLPSMYFARQVFKYSGARAAQRVAQSFYRGELGKYVLTAVGFALVFALYENQSPLALFSGYGLMLLSHAAGVAALQGS